MKKLLKVLLSVFMFVGVVGCSETEPVTTELDDQEELDKLLENYNIGEEEYSNENDISSETSSEEIQYIDAGDLDEFARVASRYDGQKVMVKGLFWRYSMIDLEDTNAVVLEYPNQEFEDTCMNNITMYARIYTYGTYDDSTGSILVDDISYINPVTEDQKCWDNTELIQASTLSQYRDYGDPMEGKEFEATVTVIDNNIWPTLAVVGTPYRFNCVGSSSLDQYKTYQILFDGLTYKKDGSTFDVNVIEAIEID